MIVWSEALHEVMHIDSAPHLWGSAYWLPLSMDTTVSVHLVQNCECPQDTRATPAWGCTKQTLHLSDGSDKVVEVTAFPVLASTIRHATIVAFHVCSLYLTSNIRRLSTWCCIYHPCHWVLNFQVLYFHSINWSCIIQSWILSMSQQAHWSGTTVVGDVSQDMCL